MAMKAPRELEDFCRGFHRDAFKMYPGLPEAIDHGIGGGAKGTKSLFDEVLKQLG